MGKGVISKLSVRIVCLVLLSSGLGLNGYAQKRHLSKRISVFVTDVTLENALVSIGKAGDFTFSYNAGLIDTDRKVTVRAREQHVDEVITDLLGERVRPREIGDHVILLMNPPKEERQKVRTESTVQGMVTELVNGNPLADATIYEVGGRRSTLSGPGGRFTLTFPDGENLRGLTICKTGYRDTVVFVRPLDGRPVSVRLSPRVTPIDRLTMQPAMLTLAEASQQGLTIDSSRLVSAFVPRKLRLNSINLHIFDTWPVQFSFVPYLSTNWKVSGSVNSAFSLNLLAGYSGGVRGFELGGLLNIDRNHVSGMQIGGLINIVGRTTTGFQLGGLGNIVNQKVTGFQLGGLFNVDAGKMTGCQIAGLFNWTGDTVRGVQLAGLFNYVPTRWRGAQIGGLANISLDHVTGFQLAGLVNIAKEENRGLQISGLVNYSRVLKGVQIGLFNISQRGDGGLPIGFYSHVHKGGYRVFEVSADEVFYINLSYKTGTKRFYNIFQAGTNDSLLINFAYGFGTLFKLGKKTSLTIDFTGSMFFSTQQDFAWYGSLLKLAPAFEYRFARHFTLFLGPALNYCFYSDRGEQAYPNGLPFYTLYDQVHSGNRQQMWIGGIIGFRI